MAAAMTGQEHQVHPGIGAGQKLVRRFTPGAFDRLPGGVFQPVDLIDAGASDDTQNRLSHSLTPRLFWSLRLTPTLLPPIMPSTVLVMKKGALAKKSALLSCGSRGASFAPGDGSMTPSACQPRPSCRQQTGYRQRRAGRSY